MTRKKKFTFESCRIKPKRKRKPVQDRDYDGWAWKFWNFYRYLYGRRYYTVVLQTEKPSGWWKIKGKLTGKWVRVKLVGVEPNTYECFKCGGTGRLPTGG